MNTDDTRSPDEPGSDEELTGDSENAAESVDGDTAGEINEGADEAVDEDSMESEDDGADDAPDADDEGKDQAGDDSNRDFTRRAAAVVIGLVVGVVPFLLGLVFFLDPLFRKRKNEDDGSDSSEGGVVKDRDGFLKLTVTREGLPDDGTPQMVTIQDDLVDAWNKFRNVPIGTIWLRKMEGTVMAFNTICPHLGCTVEFRGAEQDFYCPCHLSAFNLDGKKKNPIPPRGMDSLELKPDTGDEIWVRFMNFRGGFSEKLEI